MKAKTVIILLVVTALIASCSSPLLARNLAVENYKLAVSSLEAKEWEQAKHYLNAIILDELSHSEFFAKAVYLKTILLAAETKRNLRLARRFSAGAQQIAVDNQKLEEKFKLIAKNYRQKATRSVNTIIGLANYLMVNLPPLQVNLDYLYRGESYNQDVLAEIKTGSKPKEEKLARLENDLLVQAVNRYLQLTLSVEKFNNLSVIRARKGDTLYDLAQVYNVPFYLMLSANSHIEDPNLIYPGEKIYIPRITTSYVSYPSYFYYLSHLAYETNPKRKEAIMRLVEKAYHLTNAEEKTSDQAVRKKSDSLDDVIEIKKYKQRLQNQKERIEAQQQELKELKTKYNKLIDKLQQLTSKAKSKSKQETRKEKFAPNQDPLTY